MFSSALPSRFDKAACQSTQTPYGFCFQECRGERGKEGGREGVCAQVCGATTHTRQPSSEGNGSPASLVFLPQWVIICQLLPADLAVGTVKVVQVIIIVMLGTALCYVRNRLFSVLCCQQHPPACPLTFDASLCIDFHIAAVAYPCSYRVFGTCKFLQ